MVADDTLQVRFDSPEDLRREFEKNIANRGVFVATDVEFEVRQAVTVEVVLDYVDPDMAAITLEGEVVHCVPKEMAANGAVPGVAVQFDAHAASLRERFEPLLGKQAVTQVDADSEGEHRRGAKRGAVRVPVRIMPTMSPPFEATSRDLSATGILLSMKEDILPIGEVVRICLWHPSGDPSVEVDGKVVRQVPNKHGEVAATAIAFDPAQAVEPTTKGVIDALREAGHRSQLGGITGSLTDLGLANMLQMFGASAPQGTLVVEHEGEQGWIAFADECLLGAELGRLEGHDALVAMLDWGDGHFRFEATADARLVESAPRKPLPGAVLAAVCALDEAARDDDTAGSAGATGEEDIPFEIETEAELDLDGEAVDFSDLSDDHAFDSIELEADVELEVGDAGGAGELIGGDEGEDEEVILVNGSTTFDVDADQEAFAFDSLDKTEGAVLELVKAGMSVDRVCAIIPEPEAQIKAALGSLVELGVIMPR